MTDTPENDPSHSQDSGSSSKMQDQHFLDLKDQYEQQEVLIAQLKEMLRKSDQGNVSQEKVDKYASTLSKMNARAKKTKLKKEGELSSDPNVKRVEHVATNQKVNLLRQQLEENKAKLAERGKREKGIEEMVSQLKAQFDDSREMILQTPLNLSFVDSKIEYTKSSSAEELYNILLVKEKKISELSTKVEKLEGNVLDLQENLKEKDSVIDARTKAITLMTESLSKKGKQTLDALDETKLQMKHMQENFVKLESEMKARQVKLLEDLKLKNYEINSLEETKSNISKEKQEIVDMIREIAKSLSISENLDSVLVESDENICKYYTEEIQTKIQTLQNSTNDVKSSEESNVVISNLNERIADLNSEIERLKTSQNVPGSPENNGDAAKMKKQLDELNKNLIKTRADHKAKIKELNKKIDAFKKTSDVHAELAVAQDKIAKWEKDFEELRQENCALKEKMEEMSSKVPSLSEASLELENKNTQLSNELEEKKKLIETLELANQSSKLEIESLTARLSHVPRTQDDEQVTSEMNSIVFEEQLENQKRSLAELKEIMIREKEALQEKLDFVANEKKDIQSKLESYMQENMELIEKLDKLSAEKVSSAESIEIVENLTHQEKLELEQFQKNLDVFSGKLKITEDEHLEPESELNESVNELNEETSELLRKIDLFTMERHEVMEKMEILKQENSQLNLRINEVENNRDILSETYELLQNEKEELDKRIESLEKENAEIKQQLASNGSRDSIEEKESLRLELEQKNTDLLEQIKNLESIIEDNKNELIESSTNLTNLRSIIQEKDAELLLINDNNSDLKEKLQQILEVNENSISKTAFEEMEHQMNELKMCLQDNITKVTSYDELFNKNSLTINNLNSEVEQAKNKLKSTEDLLEENEIKMAFLTEQVKEKDVMIQSLEQQLTAKDELFHKVSNDLKEKCLSVQRQMQHNTESLEDIKKPLTMKIDELTLKNSAQVEKMKKIAANLKKKNQAYEELQAKLKDLEERLTVEKREKEDIQKSVEERMEKLWEELETCKSEMTKAEHEAVVRSESFKSAKAKLKEKIKALQRENEYLTSKIKEQAAVQEEENIKLIREHKPLIGAGEAAKLLHGEMSLRDELLPSISGDMGPSSETNTAFSKIQELELIIENQENEIVKYKNRCLALEESLYKVDEERVDLEKQTNQLGEELKEKSLSLEEISQTEYILEQKLTEISKINEENQALLKQFEIEKEELFEEKQKLIERNEALEHKVDVLQATINNLQEECEQISDLTNKIATLTKQVEPMKNIIAQLEREKEELAERGKADLERLDGDWQILFKTVLQDKTELNEAHEKLCDRIQEMKNVEENLREEIADLLIKHSNDVLVLQDKETEIIQNHNEEIAGLQAIIEKKSKEIQGVHEQLRLYQIREETQASKPLFPDIENDPFAFISKDQGDQGKPNLPTLSDDFTPNDELLQKVKTLEFMLTHSEIEKEDVTVQCSTLAYELIRLICERENLNPNDLEKVSSVLASGSVQKLAELKPIVEEPCVKKDAYLCYPDDTEKKDETDSEKKVTQPQIPVVEKPCRKKQAYLCYPGDGNIDTFGENDDGWGWGPEEAKLEEEHQVKSDTLPLVDRLKEKIRVLELEREKHARDYKELQIKAGKLMKRLKDYRDKRQDTRKTSNTDDILESAIQDELKSQIDNLEKKIKDVTDELEKQKVEKVGLRERVETLTAANERMNSNREKQEVEILMCQRKNQELCAKLNQYEWGNDEFVSKKQEAKQEIHEKSDNLAELHATIQELKNTIQDLTVDNEELQALLEEQKNLRVKAEKTKSDSQNLQIVEQNNLLQEQLSVVIEQRKDAQDQVNRFIQEHDELKVRYEKLLEEKSKLDCLISEREGLVSSLQSTIDSLRIENNNILGEFQAASDNKDLIEELKAKIEILESEKNKIAEELQDAVKNQDALNEMEKYKLELKKAKEDLFELKEENELIEMRKMDLEREVYALSRELAEHTDKGYELKAENEKLTSLLSDNDHELNQLRKEIDEIKASNATHVDHLVKEWEERVNQRGSDIAESWKLHLETRENEFSVIESKLQKEIEILTEKCNTLISENAELLKSVDAGISNEIDRINTLEQKISEKELHVNDLNVSLDEKKTEISTLGTKLNEHESLVQNLSEQIQEKDKKLNELNVDIEISRGIVNSLVMKIEERTGQRLSLEKQSLLEELERQLEEPKKELDKLHLQNEKLLNDLEAKDSELSIKSDELDGYKTSVNEYKQQLENSNEKINEILITLNDKDQSITDLTYQLQHTQSLKENENENVRNLQQSLFQCQQQCAEISRNLESKIQDIQSLSNEMLEYQRLQLMKDEEIKNLRAYLEQNEKEHMAALDVIRKDSETVINSNSNEIKTLKLQLSELEHHYSQLLNEREAKMNEMFEELQSQILRVKEYETQLEQYAALNAELNSKLGNFEELQSKLYEQNALLEEEEKQVGELKEIIENQVLKIEDLKQELYEKSNDYDSLVAQMDVNKSNVSQANNTDAENLDPDQQAHRAELDLALYMLHQRDVRCEELTMELTQLLEERDTLQLRLSNALREKEEIRQRNIENVSDEANKSGGSPSPSKSKVSEIVLKYSGTERAQEAIEDNGASNQLANKLSQLKSIGYRRDKTFVDEQEFRRVQELSIMHQHRDAASRLPPEAAARLLDASYTLSRDVQSPSKVLLNWLWGKSTPKSNEPS